MSKNRVPKTGATTPETEFNTQQERFLVVEPQTKEEFTPGAYRHFLAAGRGFLYIEHHAYRVLNFSSHGVLILSDSGAFSGTYKSAKFILDGQELTDIDLELLRTDKESERRYISAFRLIRGSFDVIPRSWVVRQIRFDASKSNFSLKLDGHSCRVVDYSAFGIAVKWDPTSTHQNSYSGVAFCLNDVEITKLNLRKVRESHAKDGVLKLAFEVTDQPINLTRVDAILKSLEVITYTTRHTTRSSEIPPAFRSAVLDLKSVLETLEQAVNKLHTAEIMESTRDRETFEGAVVENISEYLAKIFDSHSVPLERSIASIGDGEKKKCFAYFRNTLEPLLYQSPFAHRSYHKPRGYAGDAEMMKMLYRNDILGKTLFAKSLHRYYMNHPNAKAVRNRREYLRLNLLDFLTQRTGTSQTTILSVACGPAEELEELILNHSALLQGVAFHLLDQDLNSLSDAQLRIKSACSKNRPDLSVVYIHKAIRNLLTESSNAHHNMIYSAGLFDYFKDSVAFNAAQRLYSLLQPGGRLVIGNFNGGDGTRVRAVMDLALDWELIYRSKDELKKLYSPICNNLCIESESEGINLFAILTKN